MSLLTCPYDRAARSTRRATALLSRTGPLSTSLVIRESARFSDGAATPTSVPDVLGPIAPGLAGGWGWPGSAGTHPGLQTSMDSYSADGSSGTACVWMTYPVASGTEFVLFQHDVQSGTRYYQWTFKPADGVQSFAGAASAPVVDDTSVLTVRSRPYFLCAVHSGTTVQFYVDGLPTASGTITACPSSAGSGDAPYVLGFIPVASSSAHDGVTMGGAFYINRAVGRGDVATLYRAGLRAGQRRR